LSIIERSREESQRGKKSSHSLWHIIQSRHHHKIPRGHQIQKKTFPNLPSRPSQKEYMYWLNTWKFLRLMQPWLNKNHMSILLA